jgi:hypothetical protein
MSKVNGQSAAACVRRKHVRVAKDLLLYSATVLISCLYIAKGRLSNFSERLAGSTISDSGFVAGRIVVQRLDGLSPFRPGLLSSIGWPSGIENRAYINYTAPLSVATNYLLAGWTGPQNNQILFSILGMMITGLCIGLVVQHLTSSRLLASVAVVLVISSSAMLHWAQEVPSYTYIGILIALIFFCIKAVEEQSTHSILISGLLGVLSVLWLPYFALFALICLAGVCIAGMITGKPKTFSTMVKISLLTSVGFTPYSVVWCFYRDKLPARSFTESRTRGVSLKALFDFNSYFYLGITTCLICLVLLMCTFRKSIRETVIKHRTSCCFLQSSALIILICVVFLGPQQALGVPLPAMLIPKLVPWFRHGVYSSHLIQILIVLIPLIIAQHMFTSKKTKVFFVSILFLMVATDGFRQDMSGGDRLLTRVVIEKAIEVLATKPVRPVANFPWELSSEFGNNSDATPCLRQAVHKMPLVNTCDYDEPATPLIVSIQHASTCDKLEILQDASVGYLVVDFSSSQPLLSACLLTAQLNGKISLISQAGEVKVWQLSSK